MRWYFGSADPQRAWDELLGSRRLAVDVETVDLVDRTPIGIGVAASGEEAFYLSIFDNPYLPEVLAKLRDGRVQKIYHNSPYDLAVLRPFGIDISNTEDTAILCRLVGYPADLPSASFWVDMQTESAKDLMARHKAKNMLGVPTDKVGLKCSTDTLATFRLFEKLIPTADSKYYQMERAMLPVLETISRGGIGVDQERRAQIEEHYAREVEYYNAICSGMGFSAGSPYQVGFILAKRGNFLPLTRSKRQLATDEITLSRLSDPLAQMVLLYRRAEKFLGTYLRPLAGVDRAYTTLAMDAVTGRVNSSRMNLQNLPKQKESGLAPTVRSIFIPDNKVFTIIDASQIELRVLAYLSGDRRMLEVFQSGGDIHAETMKVMGMTDRINAKKFNFAMVYGADESVISGHTGIRDQAAIRRWTQSWMEGYAGAAAWIWEQRKKGWQDAKVTTLLGRQLKVPLDKGQKHAENCGVNYPIQGSAAEIFKLIMLDCRHLLDVTRVQVHDEEVFDGDVREKLDLEALAHVSPVYTPLEVRIAERWG